MMRIFARFTFCLTLILTTNGCSVGFAITGKVLEAVLVAGIQAAADGTSAGGPSPEMEEEQPPDTPCERKRQQWLEVEQTAAVPPELQCGPNGEFPTPVAK